MERAYKILFLVIIPEILAASMKSYHPDSIPLTPDYCNVTTCENPRAHTLCAYEKDREARTCDFIMELIKNEITEEEKRRIVNRHNVARGIVASGRECRGNPGPQPKATFGNLPPLEWDDELATIAQRWADQCPYYLINDQCRDVARFEVGQNMAQMNSERLFFNVDHFVDKWLEESRHFDRSLVDNYRYEAESRNYAQLIWANTTLVGCGRMTTRDTDFYTHILVCNYGPKGLNVGYPVYQASWNTSQNRTEDCIILE